MINVMSVEDADGLLWKKDGYKVTLHVYDLSNGLARQLSTAFLGKAIEAIWHTGIVVYGTEYFFGGGIQRFPAGRTMHGTPLRVVELGVTHIPQEMFEEYIKEISPRYTQETYNLLKHNCNNFSDEVAQFLVGEHIPDYILQLPNEVLNSPMGALVLPMIQNLEQTMKNNRVPEAPQFISPLTSPAVEEKVTMNGCAASESSAETVVVDDPMGSARSKVQEEITREFAAIMTTGTLRASEAAALATRRVMERHGKLNSTTVKQG